MLRRELPPGHVRVDALVGGDGLDQPGEVAVAASRPGRDGALREAQVGIRDHQLRVHLEHRAQPVAVLARAVGAVEGEVPRGQVLERFAVTGSGEVLAEHDGPGFGRLAVLVDVGVPGDHLNLGHSLGEGQRRLHRLGEASLQPVAQHQAVHDHLDGVHLVAGQVHVVAQLVGFAVHDGPAEALGCQVGQQGVVGALPPPHDRCQHLEPGALLHLQNPVHDLLGCLADQALAGLGVVGQADSGVEESQVVVHLGDGADRGTGVARGALLVDGDGR